ncbi:MAG: DUF1415 domain-containing protein [Gammaproteobacteria bacterium]|nr:DUF1415 domain-containing protein [Gammaproteobacteria bacterium]MCW8911034.1 DUF1415 domain-containing protein [Gammaproteobacteria bacterium]MCW9004536.1 DUF1415 domain-containing protein [Gammaproteobacteria bacterium]
MKSDLSLQIDRHITAQTIIARCKCWIERVVVEFNLCPFARKPFESRGVRYVVSEAESTDTLLNDMHQELELLRQTNPEKIETTVLIHPYVLNDFFDYNSFLSVVDMFLKQCDFEGEFQVASLHPGYQFADAEIDAAENYTNRSPYPILHLLREDSLAQALVSYARPDRIPERNIRITEKLGVDKMRELLDECMQVEAD